MKRDEKHRGSPCCGLAWSVWLSAHGLSARTRTSAISIPVCPSINSIHPAWFDLCRPYGRCWNAVRCVCPAVQQPSRCPFFASTFDTPLRPRTLGEGELGLSEIHPNGLGSRDGCLFFRDGPIVGERALFLMEQYRKRRASKKGSIWTSILGKTTKSRPTLLGSTWPPRDFAAVARHMMDFDSSSIPQAPTQLSPSSPSGQTRLGGTAPNGEAALVAVLAVLADGSLNCPQIGQVPQPARRRDKTVARLSVPPLCGSLFPRNGSTASKATVP